MALVAKLIPSMFHRRLALLMLVVCAGFAALLSRMSWMTIVDGSASRELAESRLIRRTWLPTTRGRVLDRTGRVLAYDQASYDVAVDYAVLSGEWSLERAKRYASRAHKDSWDLYDDTERDAIVENYRKIYQKHVDASLRTIAAYTGTPLEELLERCGSIVDRVDRQHRSIVEARVRNKVEARERMGFSVTEEDLDRFVQASSLKIREQTISHAVVEGVTDAVGFELMRMTTRQVPAMSYVKGGSEALEEHIPLFPGMEVTDNTRRVYPFDSQAVILDRSSFPLPLRDESTVRVVVEDLGSLVLGRVRDTVYREDTERRRAALDSDPSLNAWASTPDGTDRGAYRDHDRVGHTGIESAMELELRGLRGVRTEHLQTRGVTEIPPVIGEDVELTIDLSLQARIRALLDPVVGLTRVQPYHENEYMPLGTELDTGVVVMEVATGEILAMVSTPVAPRDGDWSRLGLKTEVEIEAFKNERFPYVNRAISKPYQPGSVAKALVLCGASKLGLYHQDERIEATGHLYPDRPTILRSWYYKRHSLTHFHQLGRHPDGSDALMVSSNVFFFTLGQRLGPEGINEVYSMFGVGVPIDLQIGSSWAGSTGVFDGKGGTLPVSPEDAIQMGIGQGPVTWTPLHAAQAYSTIARGGFVIEPSIVRDGEMPRVSNLGLPGWSIAAALDGLDKVANDPTYGTGYAMRFETRVDPIFNAEGIQVWGKTGTATSSPLVIDPDGDDGPEVPRVVRSGDHSWYVSLVGREGGSPEYAIAVVVDYGGSGGKVSGPINNQIIHALIAEGYLPGNEPMVDATNGRER